MMFICAVQDIGAGSGPRESQLSMRLGIKRAKVARAVQGRIRGRHAAAHDSPPAVAKGQMEREGSTGEHGERVFSERHACLVFS